MKADSHLIPVLLSTLVAGVPATAQERPDFGKPVLDMDQAEVRVEMDHASGHIVLEATVQGKGPYLFLLDTGAAGHGRIDRSLVDELGIEIVGEIEASDGSGRAAPPMPWAGWVSSTVTVLCASELLSNCQRYVHENG